MATTFKTPGVYIQEISKFPPSVVPVATAIPAFIGYTEKALRGKTDLLNVPTRITSLAEYEEWFGGAMPENFTIVVDESLARIDDQGTTVRTGIEVTTTVDSPSLFNLYYSLRSYFDNGGGPCYILSIGKYTTTDPAPIDVDSIIGALDLLKKEDEPTLIVIPEASNIAEAGGGPGVNPAANFGTVYQQALLHCSEMQDRFTVMSVWQSPDDQITDAQNIANFRDAIGNNFLNYGAAYYPYIETVYNFEVSEASTITHNTAVTMLDGSVTNNPNGGSLDGEELNADTVTQENNDIYNLILAEISQLRVVLPPESAVVGIYASVDNTRGVWKAPANVSVSSIVKPTIKINDAEQEDLNVHTTGKSINAIRNFTGKGNLVWGARTLDGNSNEWRYVSVRRFFIFAEESIKKATEAFVFEPNDANTWTKVRALIENFLLLQWRAGALAGAVPEDAFFVRVGLPETMTSLDILEGRMNVEIGMAVVRPAEFIILKFSHKLQVS